MPRSPLLGEIAMPARVTASALVLAMVAAAAGGDQEERGEAKRAHGEEAIERW